MDTTEGVRLAVYDRFRHGETPTISGLASATRLGPDVVRRCLVALDRSRDLVFDTASERIVMAHPFTAIPLGFAVMGREHLWWGGCAWDSFAIPHLLDEEPEVLVSTTCPGCGDALAWVVGRDAPPTGSEIAHFLTPVSHIWDDVVHACAHQRLFCSEACVRRWLEREAREPGYMMDLATLWRLARDWYRGRLQPGYRRREPADAAAYFASVGLKGPFWGLPAAEE